MAPAGRPKCDRYPASEEACCCYISDVCKCGCSKFNCWMSRLFNRRTSCQWISRLEMEHTHTHTQTHTQTHSPEMRCLSVCSVAQSWHHHHYLRLQSTWRLQHLFLGWPFSLWLSEKCQPFFWNETWFKVDRVRNQISCRCLQPAEEKGLLSSVVIRVHSKWRC